ncbi:MAG: phosphate ABC transporter permease PstA [Bacteroidetes bacterium]|nr:phosphate ABC transporter permease PstA [Bacteroidota bacterium]
MTSAEKNRIKDKLFGYFGLACTLFGIIMLLVFLSDIVMKGWEKVDFDFLTNYSSSRPKKAGIYPALAGTLWILGLTALIAIPIGIAAGIYFEEYAKKSKMANFLEINLANLAGVPSIIYGLLGLQIFVRSLNFGASILAGACTLALLILPIIIVSTREALKAVPDSIRQASYGMGANTWQTIWHQVLPASAGGIITGIILAISRAIGETAPLIVIGAATYITYIPEGPMDKFTVLPMQVYDWIGMPDPEFAKNAAGGIIILLLITFLLNGIAVYLRNRWQKKVKW